MLNFSSLNSRFRYYLEGLFSNLVNVKIDRFDLNNEETTIIVIFRLGRQKLAQKLIITDFSAKYFTNLSEYDRQRITKFSTLQDLLANLFSTDGTGKQNLINYIKAAVKNDQLF